MAEPPGSRIRNITSRKGKEELEGPGHPGGNASQNDCGHGRPGTHENPGPI